MLYKRLRELNLTEDQISGVISVLLEGTPIQVTATAFTLDSEAVKITQVPNSPSALCNFEIDVAGLNAMQIKSIQLPAFDYSSTAVLTMKVEILPLAVAQDMVVSHKLSSTEEPCDSTIDFNSSSETGES